MDFVSSLNLSPNFLKSYDFNGAKVKLLASVSGYHCGKDLNKYGHMKLREHLQSYFEFPTQKIVEDCTMFQMSSIGGIDRGAWFKEEFLTSLQTTRKEEPKQKRIKRAEGCIKLLFPTVNTVHQSSMIGSAMIFLNSQNWNSSSFPKEILFDCKNVNSKRDHILMHSKILLRDILLEDNTRIGWCYIGSHNLSPSAWGKLQKNSNQLHLANYELGILFVDEGSQHYKCSIPFQIPPPLYQSTDQPWLFEK